MFNDSATIFMKSNFYNNCFLLITPYYYRSSFFVNRRWIILKLQHRAICSFISAYICGHSDELILI